jgi:hypothetical protein
MINDVMEGSWTKTRSGTVYLDTMHQDIDKIFSTGGEKRGGWRNIVPTKLRFVHIEFNKCRKGPTQLRNNPTFVDRECAIFLPQTPRHSRSSLGTGRDSHLARARRIPRGDEIRRRRRTNNQRGLIGFRPLTIRRLYRCAFRIDIGVTALGRQTPGVKRSLTRRRHIGHRSRRGLNGTR